MRMIGSIFGDLIMEDKKYFFIWLFLMIIIGSGLFCFVLFAPEPDSPVMPRSLFYFFSALIFIPGTFGLSASLTVICGTKKLKEIVKRENELFKNPQLKKMEGDKR